MGKWQKKFPEHNNGESNSPFLVPRRPPPPPPPPCVLLFIGIREAGKGRENLTWGQDIIPTFRQFLLPCIILPFFSYYSATSIRNTSHFLHFSHTTGRRLWAPQYYSATLLKIPAKLPLHHRRRRNPAKLKLWVAMNKSLVLEMDRISIVVSRSESHSAHISTNSLKEAERGLMEECKELKPHSIMIPIGIWTPKYSNNNARAGVWPVFGEFRIPFTNSF